MKGTILIIIMFLCAVAFEGCTKCGCTDLDAINYDESAEKDDGSCIYDYRHIRIGTYVGTKTTLRWHMTIDDYGEVGGESYEIGPDDVTLEVLQAAKDSVLEIKETADSSRTYMYFLRSDGHISRFDFLGHSAYGHGYFVDDSLVFSVGGGGLGASVDTYYKCKKIQR